MRIRCGEEDQVIERREKKVVRGRRRKRVSLVVVAVVIIAAFAAMATSYADGTWTISESAEAPDTVLDGGEMGVYEVNADFEWNTDDDDADSVFRVMGSHQTEGKAKVYADVLDGDQRRTHGEDIRFPQDGASGAPVRLRWPNCSGEPMVCSHTIYVHVINAGPDPAEVNWSGTYKRTWTGMLQGVDDAEELKPDGEIDLRIELVGIEEGPESIEYNQDIRDAGFGDTGLDASDADYDAGDSDVATDATDDGGDTTDVGGDDSGEANDDAGSSSDV